MLRCVAAESCCPCGVLYTESSTSNVEPHAAGCLISHWNNQGSETSINTLEKRLLVLYVKSLLVHFVLIRVVLRPEQVVENHLPSFPRRIPRVVANPWKVANDPITPLLTFHFL